MEVSDLLRPFTPKDFKANIFDHKAVLLRKNEGFPLNLLTVDEIEAALNNGANLSHSVRGISKNGTKMTPQMFYQPSFQSSFVLNKKLINEFMEEGNTFIVHNCSQLNAKVTTLFAQLEEFFYGMHGDLHLWISSGKGARSLDAHRDRPQHKFYMQMVGETNWTVYQNPVDVSEIVDESIVTCSDEFMKENFEIAFTATLCPGDSLYMPPGTFHKVIVDEKPRISLSFLLVPSESPPVDRTQIDLRHLLSLK
jgi:ribosomal protein L16 Arg81 hydroxylase